MKLKLTVTLTVLFIIFMACNTNEEKQVQTTNTGTLKTPSPIEGNWILVSNEVYGKQVAYKRNPPQLKMIHDGYFSFMMYDSAGSFYYAGAGPYEVKGNMYKETFTWSSDTAYNDSKDWQRWEMKGDTLIFYGFEKAELLNGKDVTDEWVEKINLLKKE